MVEYPEDALRSFHVSYSVWWSDYLPVCKNLFSFSGLSLIGLIGSCPLAESFECCGLCFFHHFSGDAQLGSDFIQGEVVIYFEEDALLLAGCEGGDVVAHGDDECIGLGVVCWDLEEAEVLDALEFFTFEVGDGFVAYDAYQEVFDGFIMVLAELVTLLPDQEEGILHDVLGCCVFAGEVEGDAQEALLIVLVEKLDCHDRLFG